MSILSLLVIMSIFAILIVSIVFYKKVYENKVNKVLESGTPKKILSPLKVFIGILLVLIIGVALSWNLLFPDYIKRDIDQEYSVNELFGVYNDILDIHDLNDDEVFFTAGDYLQLRLDDEFILGDNSHNQISFDIDGIHHRIQFIVFGTDEEVWIPVQNRRMNWTVDELYSPQIRYRTMLQVLEHIDIEEAISEIGSLDEDGYYVLRVEGEFVTNYSSIEFFINENKKLYEMNEVYDLSLMSEDVFDEDATYLSIQIVRFGKDSETTYSEKDSITYYFDVSGYLID